MIWLQHKLSTETSLVRINYDLNIYIQKKVIN